MKKTILLLALVLPFLSACNQTTGNSKNLRTTTAPNEVARANLSLGIEYMNRGEYEKSLEKLDRARAADPGYSGTYNVYGLLYQLLNRNDEAEKQFKKALKLNPRDSDTMNNYGRLLCGMGRSEEAERTFMQAANNPLYATPAVAITNAGICANRNNRPLEAEKHFRNALEINEQIPTALLQMSQLTFNNANYLSARAYLQRYLGVSRHTSASLWLGIQIEREMGDKDALSSYILSLKNNFPDSNEASLLTESEANH